MNAHYTGCVGEDLKIGKDNIWGKRTALRHQTHVAKSRKIQHNKKNNLTRTDY